MTQRCLRPGGPLTGAKPRALPPLPRPPQSRVMYATYLKVAGGPMKAFTRVLHRHTDDELMHEARAVPSTTRSLSLAPSCPSGERTMNE